MSVSDDRDPGEPDQANQPGQPELHADLIRAIEAIVMVATEPVPPESLAQLLEVPLVLVEQLCRALAGAYEAGDHGFQLVKVAGGYRYQSHPDMAMYVERYLLDGQRARLSGAALETLAIVAYKQPISRAQVAAIRGVDPDGVLRTLQARGYIDEVGRDPGPGQAILFGTTPLFLEKLGLASVSDLPPLAEFVPGADVVEALEHGLRVESPPVANGTPPPEPAEGAPMATAEPPAKRPGSGPPKRRVERPLWEQWAEKSAQMPTGERLQKVLAERGWGSRRACEDLIAAGRVMVNGEVAVLGRRVEPARDRVEVDGVPVGLRPDLVYYLLNKPAGVVTTASDTHGRTTVVDLVPDQPRVFPVGRLDLETEGLLLLTNDGDLAHHLTHPSHGIEKEYLAEVAGGSVAAGKLRALREGVELDDGVTAPAKVAQPSPGVLRITIHEGRNRQVRRMCEAVGHPVRRLVRVRIGPLRDQQLAPGAWRLLTADEVRRLSTVAASGPRYDRAT